MAEDLKKSFQDWEEKTVQKSLSKAKERKAKFTTGSGLEYKRVYTPLDIEGEDYVRDLGFPSKFPFTRGVQPTMYRGRPWTMRQYSGFGTAKETNERFRFLLKEGQTGLSIAFDLPTQMGYDSDHALAKGEVGKVGVSIDSLADMEVLFDQIPLDKVSTSMTINSTAAVLLAMYIAIGEKQGVEAKKLRGTIQNDMLKEYIARGTYIFPPRPSIRVATDIMAFCKDAVPEWNTISISGYHMREKGCTAVQEVAFTLADGLEYIKAVKDAGLDAVELAQRFSFFFNAHNDFLEEIAKFRAARRLWARLLQEKGITDPKAQMLRFHTQTAGCTLTAQQPMNNVVRVALQALAAVLGGTQSLHTNSLDEAFSLPTQNSVRLALRTQQLISEESGVTNTIDPLAGSYAVEALTNQIEEGARVYLKKVEEMGGMIPAIESGYVQREIEDASYRYQLEIEKKERIVVGVNEYKVDEPLKFEVLKIDPKKEAEQVQGLVDVRKKRDNAALKSAMAEVKKAAEGKDNLMPPILKAVKAYGTIGEISDTLRAVFGEYREKI
ncbi:MAG: methylmalonyl-CoA mutase family protein [Proteobacteria bacterium]|nr:methylmalonyl-CoA mutase family protein [Pseudomonadota bacterium]